MSLKGIEHHSAAINYGPSKLKRPSGFLDTSSIWKRSHLTDDFPRILKYVPTP